MVRVGDEIQMAEGDAPSWMYSVTMFLNKYGSNNAKTLERTMRYATSAREGGVEQEVTFKELEAIITGVKLEQTEK